MNCRIPLAMIALVSAPLPSSIAQDPPKKIPSPDKATLDQIGQKTRQLFQQTITLQRLGIRDPILADVEIYLKAAQWIDKLEEYTTHEQAANWTLSVLDRGLLRASQALRGESPWLAQTGSSFVRAYRSRVDGSLQPYAVTLPRDYGRDPKTRWRLDVVLHGRDKSLTEVKFLQQHSGEKEVADQPYVTLEIFGRGNNAYRWAGETDVLEAIESFVAVERALGRDWVDPKRVVLRGFSMGGAGTWHIGLHRPDRWAVIGPGAGFTTTRGYVKDLPDRLPEYVEKCLRIYDAVDYAPNAFNVPVVAYSGENDPQLQAALNIEAKLKTLSIPMTHLIAPKLKHEFPAEWRKKAETEYAKFAGPGRKDYPDRVRFSTFTLKYSGCDWVEILGLGTHYERGEVDAARTENGFEVRTKNVRTLRLMLPGGDTTKQIVVVDGENLSIQPSQSASAGMAVYLQKNDGKWASILPQFLTTQRLRQLQKIGGLQGPIDDAFTDSFLCVRGSGAPWHPTTGSLAEARLKQFQADWRRFFRGDLPVKNDTDVTDEDIATKSLILFGDPASNNLIAQVMGGLPMKWNEKEIEFRGQMYSANGHLPAMIYPSPLNINRYIVLNSGHTFGADDLMGTNALLYPRLGDFAILKHVPSEKNATGVEVVDAGLFDESWLPTNQK